MTYVPPVLSVIEARAATFQRRPLSRPWATCPGMHRPLAMRVIAYRSDAAQCDQAVALFVAMPVPRGGDPRLAAAAIGTLAGKGFRQRELAQDLVDADRAAERLTARRRAS